MMSQGETLFTALVCLGAGVAVGIGGWLIVAWLFRRMEP